MNQPVRIAVVGHLTLDTYVDFPRRTVDFEVPAGNALGAALGANLWGVEVILLARVGQEYPVDLLRELEAHGILLDGLSLSNSPSLRFWIFNEGAGFSRDLPFEDADFAEYSPPSEVLERRLSEVRAVHICPMPLQAQHQLAALAHRQGLLVSVDPFPWNHSNLSRRAYMKELIAISDMTDILSLSEEEWIAALPPKTNSKFPSIQQFRSPIIVLRQGSRGSVIFLETQPAYSIPIYPSSVLNEVGAGDAYCGGFLGSFAGGEEIGTAGRRGAVSASLVVEQVGITHLLDASAIAESRLREIHAQSIRKA